MEHHETENHRVHVPEEVRAEVIDPATGKSKPAGFGSDLPKRIITGAVYAVVMCAGLMVSKYTTVLLVAAMSGICTFEFYRMMRKDGKLPNEIVGIVASVLYPVVFFIGSSSASGGRTLIFLLTMVFMAVMLIWYVFSPRVRIVDIAVTVFGALYCGMMLSCLVGIRLSEPGRWYIGGSLAFGVVLSVWVNDVLAYFIGSKFGKHKLAPKISPKKSWEGFFAGVVGSVIVWMLIPLIVDDLPFVWAALGGILCGFIAVFGDFVESRIKRGAGVKDSGNILPGHGGLLDRCDSLIFVSVVAYMVLIMAGVS